MRNMVSEAWAFFSDAKDVTESDGNIKVVLPKGYTLPSTKLRTAEKALGWCVEGETLIDFSGDSLVLVFEVSS